MAVAPVSIDARTQSGPRASYAERRAELMRADRPGRRAGAGVAARAPAQRRRALQVPAGQRHPLPDRVRGAGDGGRAAPGPREDAVRDVRAPARSRRGDLDGPPRRRRRRGARLRRRRRRSSPPSWTTSWPRSVAGAQEIHFPFGREPALDAAVARLLGRLRAAERRGRRAPVRLVDARADAARDAAHQVAARARDPAARRRRSPREAHIARHASPRSPARSEHEIEALVDYTFRKNGAHRSRAIRRSSAAAPTRPSSTTSRTARRCVRGQLLLIDAGCEIDGYTADVTRTFPIGARFSPAQRRLYEAVLETQIGRDRGGEAGRDAGRDPRAGRRAADAPTWWRWACSTGDVPALIEAGALQAVLHAPHQPLAGHGRARRRLLLEGGAARAAGARDGADHRARPLRRRDAPVPAEFRGLGVRIEDDILVTADGLREPDHRDAEVGRRHRAPDRVGAPHRQVAAGSESSEVLPCQNWKTRPPPKSSTA